MHPRRFANVHARPLIRVSRTRFKAKQDPTTCQLRELPRGVRLPANKACVRMFEGAVGRSVPRVTHRNTLITMSFVPFRLSRPVAATTAKASDLVTLLLRRRARTHKARKLPSACISVSRCLNVNRRRALLTQCKTTVMRLGRLALRTKRLGVAIVGVRNVGLLLLGPMIRTTLPRNVTLHVRSNVVCKVVREAICKVRLRKGPATITARIIRRNSIVTHTTRTNGVQATLLRISMNNALIRIYRTNSNLRLTSLNENRLLRLFGTCRYGLNRHGGIILTSTPTITFRVGVALGFSEGRALRPNDLMSTLLASRSRGLVVRRLNVRRQDGNNRRPLLRVSTRGLLIILRVCTNDRANGEIDDAIPDERPLRVNCGKVRGQHMLQVRRKACIHGTNGRPYLIRTTPRHISMTINRLHVLLSTINRRSFRLTTRHVFTRLHLFKGRLLSVYRHNGLFVTLSPTSGKTNTVLPNVHMTKTSSDYRVPIVIKGILHYPDNNYLPDRSMLIRRVARTRRVFIVVVFAVARSLLFRRTFNDFRRLLRAFITLYQRDFKDTVLQLKDGQAVLRGGEDNAKVMVCVEIKDRSASANDVLTLPITFRTRRAKVMIISLVRVLNMLPRNFSLFHSIRIVSTTSSASTVATSNNMNRRYVLINAGRYRYNDRPLKDSVIRISRNVTNPNASVFTNLPAFGTSNGDRTKATKLLTINVPARILLRMMTVFLNTISRNDITFGSISCFFGEDFC